MDFIDPFLRLHLGTTEGRCVLRTQQLAGSCVATQTSKGERVSGDVSSQVTGDFGVLSVFPRPWNERNRPNSAMPREAGICKQGWPCRRLQQEPHLTADMPGTSFP